MPTDLSSNILLGVISGLLATLLTVGFRRIWLSIIVPWFEELVYKDAKLEGTWYVLYDDMDDDRYDVVTVKRTGHHVTAHMTCSASDDAGKTYCIIGSFRNLILSATYETEDRQGLDRGSMTLMLTANGKRMVGFIAFYSDPNHEISDSPTTWYREKADFDKDFKERVERDKDDSDRDEH